MTRTRRAPSRRLSVVIALGTLAYAAAACAHAPAAGAAAPGPAARAVDLLAPGARMLRPLSAPSRRVRYHMVMRDTTPARTERVVATGERAYETLDGGMLRLTWGYASSGSADTLTVRAAGLWPASERLRAQGQLIEVQYDGGHVTGTVRHGDSAAVPFEVKAPVAPFAFNELEVLVQSLPLRRGTRVVVPLFSEMDRDVEYDTLSVLGPDTTRAGASAAPWLVRFADPVIVSIFQVDSATGAILARKTTGRKSGRSVRYVHVG